MDKELMKSATVPDFAPWPCFTAEETEAVAAVLMSNKVNYWTGEVGRAFEDDYAHHTGRRHGIAVANGTVALELALHAFGIGPGDEVVTSSRTYVSSASCAVLRGATPVMADVHPDSQCITADTIAAVLSRKTKAIVVVHLGGWPCAMDDIMALAEQRGLIVIEDCAQAHGARFKGRPVGSFGHAAAFSFCQDKIISTGGEGGMLVLDDEHAWARAWAYKDIGRSFDATYKRVHAPGFRWVTESFGTNWRMTEMQAVLGRIQLRRLQHWVERRRCHAASLRAALEDVPGIRVAPTPPDVYHAYYRFYVEIEAAALKQGWDRLRVMAEINELGVPCTVGSCSEIYLEKAFTDAGFGPATRFPVARRLGESSLAFLVHPTLSDDAIAYTGRAIRQVMLKACGGAGAHLSGASLTSN
jgi:dTDP-4-amino-4,6-dideoxygalactose transaminase